MIIPPGPLKVTVATKPVDFRKGAIGLAALVEHELGLKPFCGVAYIFRSRRANRLKLLVWDGTGLVLVSKVLQTGNFHWPRAGDGVMRLSTGHVTARPKLACRACSDGVFQAPAPRHVVPGGLPTEALIADILVKKYADELPFYRQAQALRRQGIVIDRGALCNWAGTSAAWLGWLTSRMKQDLLTSARLFADETTRKAWGAKMLAPGTGKTRTGYLWAIARDDRAHGGGDPPAVVYSYMPGRGRVWAEKLLGDFTGIVQCDGYAAYKHIEAPDRKGGLGALAFCWAHVRRGYFDEAKGGHAPVAQEALRQIARLYEIEAGIRGSNAEHRRAVRQADPAPVIAAMLPWLRDMLPRLPRGSKTAEAIGYTLNHWHGLVRFLDGGRIELDNNTVERAIRPLTLQRKNALCRPRPRRRKLGDLRHARRDLQAVQHQSTGLSHRCPRPHRPARRYRPDRRPASLQLGR